MAHISRPTYTIPIPSTAKPCTVRGKPGVKWKGKGGREVTGTICVSNPARCLVRSPRYYIYYTDENGRERCIPSSKDQSIAQQHLANILRNIELVKLGIITDSDQATHAPATGPIGTEMNRYRKYLLNQGRTKKHADLYYRRIETIVEHCKFLSVSEIALEPVQEFLAAKRTGDRPIGDQTCLHYCRAIKSFTRWLSRGANKKLKIDPLSELTYRVEKLVHERRVLKPEEFDRFIASTEKRRGNIRGLSGPERAALYRFAARTGLRAEEISQLSLNHFDLEANPPIVRLEAAKVKNRKATVLPLSAAVVEIVRKMAQGKRPSEKLWPKPSSMKEPWWRAASILVASDLKQAGIPYRDAQGRYFDFHSLRSQFITDLDRAGVSLVQAQKLARHSSPTITAKYYSRHELDELKDALDKLK